MCDQLFILRFMSLWNSKHFTALFTYCESSTLKLFKNLKLSYANMFETYWTCAWSIVLIFHFSLITTFKRYISHCSEWLKVEQYIHTFLPSTCIFLFESRTKWSFAWGVMLIILTAYQHWSFFKTIIPLGETYIASTLCN